MLSLTYILYKDIGVISILIPFMNILIIFIQQKIAIKLKDIVARRNKLADQRGKLIAEVVSGIKMVKFNAWEEVVLSKIDEYRKRERSLLISLYKWNSVLRGLKIIMPKLSSLILFSFIWGMSKTITIPQMFSILSILNYIEIPLAGIMEVLKSHASTQVASLKMKKILQIREKQPISDSPKLSRGEVKIDTLSCTWRDNYHEELFAKSLNNLSTAAVLNSISLRFRPGTFTGIFGPVGAGKSTLLLSILSEVPIISGTSKKNGKISYISQQSFLSNDSIRNNIIFGEEFDKQQYKQVIRICQLEHDLELLDAGDLTEIGEQGINLSGGQKQRICIARAVYANADIYIIDDALSAVDTDVGNQIMEEVFIKQLKGKTRIMVTHKLAIRSRFDELIYMEQGRVIAQGTLNEVEKNEEFQLFIENTSRFSSSTSQINQVVNPKLIVNKKENKDKGKLTKLENYNKGQVGLGTYLFYINSGGLKTGIVTISLFFLSTMMSIWLDWWIGDHLESVFGKSSTLLAKLKYILLIGMLVIVVIIRMTLSGRFATDCSYNIFKAMIYNILRRPMSYFDTIPSGIIMNRCTKDTFSVDYSLPDTLMQGLETAILFFLTFLIASYYTVIVSIFALIFMYVIKRYLVKFMKTSIQLSRMSKITSSPVLTKLTEMINGAVIIRQFRKQQYFKDKFEEHSDLDSTVMFHELISDAWLKLRLETSILLIIWASIFALAIGKINGNFGSQNVVATGLILNYLLLLSNMTGSFMSVQSRTMKEISGVERMQEFIEYPEQEAPWTINNDLDEWPENGDIDIQNLSVRYRTGLPLILDNLNLKIESGEKVGIIGRTGSGKSTLFLALSRLIEPSNDLSAVFIDDVNIKELGLHQLRKSLRIIPQEPFLLEGTVRFNVDPFNEYSDKEVMESLSKVGLPKSLSTNPSSLLSLQISASGGNLSAGQRQLLSISRALISRPRILLMDEATSSIDESTDTNLQSLFKKELRNSTVITIAHRLETLKEYEKIVLVENGRVGKITSYQELCRNSEVGEFL